MINRPAVKALTSFLNQSGHQTDQKILVLNGLYLQGLQDDRLDIIQPDYRQARLCQNLILRPEGFYREIWVFGSKQRQETRAYIGSALLAAAPNARIIIALENDMGGKTIANDLSAIGLKFESDARAHTRLYIIDLTAQIFDKGLAAAWQSAGLFTHILDGAYVSCPGLHGWDQVDEGSSLLVKMIDKPLKGTVADFGCGYGYLSVQILKAHPRISKFYYLDCDARALEATKKNIDFYKGETQPVWCDLTLYDAPEKFDFIVMNPPFHQGQSAESAYGQRFIKTAAYNLKEGGTLWLVANRHLPYEETLKSHFQDFKFKADQKGFKVYEAIK